MEIPYSFETLIEFEQKRQNDNIELIASENFCSERVRNACGSILTNKYAEGYPGKRYYGGCSFIDLIEQKAINNACELFNCKFANVQPHCGSSANQAVYRALLKPGDTVLAMDLGAGGHLTHGHKLSFSGQDYNIVPYGVDDNGVINYKDIEEKLFTINPQMILVGASSYSQIIDFERIARMIEDYYNVNGERPFYFVDMAHIAGLVAAGVHPSPFPWADVVTTTTHKTLRGPRGGLILWNNEEYTNSINKAVFPGIQGGPLEHIIAAKGICFEEALQPEFKEYAKQIISNAKAFADEFIKLGAKVISGGTQNHLFVLDVYSSYGITGKDAEELLDEIKITVNKNQIPNDTLSPLVSSGIRIGTPAMTTKGWTEDKFRVLANIIDKYLKNHDSETFNKEIAEKEVERLIKDDKEVEDLITHDSDKTLFYVFLDIDGVLNNERHISKCYDMNGHHAMHMNHVPFDPDCLDNLMKLVRFLEEKHEVRIVLSSTWRLHVIDKEIVEARLAEYGLKIHSVTPYKHADRGLEIKQYLEDNDKASGIIILDDDKEDIVPYYPVQLVKTDFYSGLDSEVVKRAKFKYMEGDLWI